MQFLEKLVVKLGMRKKMGSCEMKWEDIKGYRMILKHIE